MRKLVLMALAAVLTTSAFGQLSASGSTLITLRKASSITLSLRSVPVSVNVTNSLQQPFLVPLQLNWNVNPTEVPGFRVVAYFDNSQAALTESSHGKMIPARDIVSRWLDSDFLPFSTDGTVTLFQTMTHGEFHRGTEQGSLELQIASNAVTLLPDGDYQGVLYLEIRNY